MMDKKAFSIILIFIGLVSCGRVVRVTLQPIVRISLPPIVDGEVNTYGVYRSEDSPVPERIKTVITNRVTTAPAWSDIGNAPGEQAFRITVVETETSARLEAYESTVVYLSREDMHPIASSQTLRTPKQTTVVIARYHDGIVEISTNTFERLGGATAPFSPDIQAPDSQRSFPIGAMTFDVSQLEALGRAVNFLQQKPLNILVVVPKTTPPGGMSVSVQATHCGTDTITTPAGTFDCYKLKFTTPDSTVTLWFEKVGARRLIKRKTVFALHPESTGVIIKLLSFTIGGHN